MLPADARSTGICEGAEAGDVQDGQTGETDFLRVDLLPQADRDPDDPSSHEVVSLNSDILLTLHQAALAKVTVPGFGGTLLFGRLPSLGANEMTNLLLSASSSLADAEAITLLIQPSSGQ